MPKPLRMYYIKVSTEFFAVSFADILPKQTGKLWNRLGILLQTHLAPEFSKAVNSWLLYNNLKI